MITERLAEQLAVVQWAPGEAGSRFGQHVDARRFDDFVAVAAGLKALVVDDDDKHVFLLRRSGRWCRLKQQQQQAEDCEKTAIHGVAFSLRVKGGNRMKDSLVRIPFILIGGGRPIANRQLGKQGTLWERDEIRGDWLEVASIPFDN